MRTKTCGHETLPQADRLPRLEMSPVATEYNNFTAIHTALNLDLEKFTYHSCREPYPAPSVIILQNRCFAPLELNVTMVSVDGGRGCS